MKVNEITGVEDEPLLIALIRQRLNKGERVAIYYRTRGGFSFNTAVKPMWITGIQHVKQPGGPGIDTSTSWVFRCNKGRGITYQSYDAVDFDDNFELAHGKTKGAWQFRRRAANIKEGVGSDLMDYVDFAEQAYNRKPLRDKVDKLAHDLFRLGFSFKVSKLGKTAQFTKTVHNGTRDEEHIIIWVISHTIGAPNTRSVDLRVSVNGWDYGTGQPRGKHQTLVIDQVPSIESFLNTFNS
jgi:hypothetical protein